MFFVEADEVVEGKAVVTGDEVNGVEGVAGAGLVEIRAAGNAGGQIGHTIVMTGHKAPHIIAKPAIPLGPAGIGREGTNLIKTGGIPGLGDDFDVAQHRVFGDHLDHRRIGQEISGGVAAQDRGEVKAKAVNVHLHDPEAQGVQDQFPHYWMVAVHGIAAAGKVQVPVGGMVKQIVDTVVNTAETAGCAIIASLAGVVEDHVEDDLNPRLMQGEHHGLEFIDVSGGIGGIAGLEGKK